ncbi:glutamate synthase [NADPH] large chain [Aquipluma nitroreducens]|uniref:Glutamate synthase [NADPH] large chain n=1 Tax=Aquipluma nitroreducens TaxID=2010828 RepID=A0A5K7SCF9_9BACT|nr:helix-hairpin-helix domain-containing protein [Aquipluma nitroreducens]BBE19282.1 glutamate synthase [NADPH] large chain [Aquipluma nitroreducens]
MNFRQIIQDYFTFSRNERKGIVVLLILIFLLAVANKVIFYFEKPAKIDIALMDSARHELGQVIDSINQQETSQKLFLFNPNTIDSLGLDSLDIPTSVKLNLLKFRNSGGKFYTNADFRKIYGMTEQLFNKVSPFLLLENKSTSQKVGISTPDYFPFDPNKATDDEFFRLGLSDKQVATIRKYLDKGGVFRSKEDFFKIRVISSNQKNNLADWIVITGLQKVIPEKNLATKTTAIEINSTDSIQLKQMPGIGSVLSKRIVKYRDLLGGFYSISQLKEVYGLTEQTISLFESKITVDISKIKKLDVNFADLNELSRHPYLKKDLASKIVKYRTKHGSFRDLTILRDSMILNIDEYNRIKPYF